MNLLFLPLVYFTLLGELTKKLKTVHFSLYSFSNAETFHAQVKLFFQELNLNATRLVMSRLTHNFYALKFDKIFFALYFGRCSWVII